MKLTEIRIDGGTQTRLKMSDEVVQDYANSMKDGDQFPPLVVYYDGKDNWLADGFHRYFAYQMAGIKDIDVTVKRGSIVDAKFYALGANKGHGLRTTNADKRNAVLMALTEPAWKGWSNREIARHCGVTHTFVNNVKSSLETVSTPPKDKPAKKQLPQVDAPEYDESDHMRETIAVLNEELEIASRAAAAGVLAEGMENAREIMERQAQEIKTLQAENDGLKATRDTMMVEIKELKKQCAYYQKKMKELNK